jgi:hypothetical protein
VLPDLQFLLLVSVAEMVCGVDPGTYIFEGSDVQENWAMYFGSAVGEGGGGDKAEEGEDVLGAIPGGGGQQQLRCKH